MGDPLPLHASILDLDPYPGLGAARAPGRDRIIPIQKEAALIALRRVVVVLAIATLVVAGLRLLGMDNGSPGESATTPPATAARSGPTPACPGAWLSLAGVGQGENGIVNIGVTIRNDTDAPCTLAGPPSVVTLLRGDGEPLQTDLQGPVPTPAAPLVLRPRGASAAMLTLFWMNWCQGDLASVRIRWVLPGTAGSVVGPLTGLLHPRCDYPGRPSTLTVDGIGGS